MNNNTEQIKEILQQYPINYNKLYPFFEKYAQTEEFLRDIKEYKFNGSNSFDMLIETLAWTMAFQNKPVEASLEAELKVYENYPFLIYNIMFLKTIDRQKEYLQKIIDLYEDIEGVYKEDKFNENIKIYKNYIDNFETNFKKNSSLVNFNYLAGVRFDKINVPYNELPKNCLIINIGYNSSKQEGEIICGNVLYGDIKSIQTLTITQNDIKNIKLNEKVNIYSRKKCYEIITDNPNNPYKIVINYNNDKDDKKCFYSISKNEVPKMFITILTHGGTICKVKNQTMKVYFSETLTRKYGIKPKENLKEELFKINSNISVQLSDRYDENVDKTIENWKGFNNDEIFDLCLNKLYDFDTFDEETKKHILNYNNYVCVIKNYFFPIEDYVD